MSPFPPFPLSGRRQGFMEGRARRNPATGNKIAAVAAPRPASRGRADVDLRHHDIFFRRRNISQTLAHQMEPFYTPRGPVLRFVKNGVRLASD